MEFLFFICLTAKLPGGPKIVLDHVYVLYVCVLWVSSLLVGYDAIDNASLSRAHEDLELATHLS